MAEEKNKPKLYAAVFPLIREEDTTILFGVEAENSEVVDREGRKIPALLSIPRLIWENSGKPEELICYFTFYMDAGAQSELQTKAPNWMEAIR